MVAFALGFAVGLAKGAGRLNPRYGWVTLWLVTFGVGSTLATVLNLAFLGGRTGVPLADSLYDRLLQVQVLGGPLPKLLLAYVAQAAIELPDKLLTVLAAVAIFSALPERVGRVASEERVLNIGSAFTSIFRSPQWLRKVSFVALCVVLSWLLLIPLLLFAGYLVAVARTARDGVPYLPGWDGLRRKLRDGVALTGAFLIWVLPGAAAEAAGSGVLGLPLVASRVLDGVGTIWIVLVLLSQGAIWAQLLESGFVSAVDPTAVVRRILPSVGATAVVGTLGWALGGAALLGVLMFVLGAVVTVPYCSLVAARLFGDYARITDDARRPEFRSRRRRSQEPASPATSARP